MKRDDVINLVLFALIMWLLIMTPQYPVNKWQVPCYVFCVVVLVWLAPEVARALARLTGKREDRDA